MSREKYPASSGISAALRKQRSVSMPQFSTMDTSMSRSSSSSFTRPILEPAFIKIFTPGRSSPRSTPWLEGMMWIISAPSPRLWPSLAAPAQKEGTPGTISAS